MSAEDHGVHSAALHTVNIDGIAIRCGRRFLSRLVRKDGSLDFLVSAYINGQNLPAKVAFPVELLDEWENAEAYDSCTIYGRILLRQYDDSSDSEHSDSEEHLGLAVLDFIY
jgi:hypothetical protein